MSCRSVAEGDLHEKSRLPRAARQPDPIWPIMAGPKCPDDRPLTTRRLSLSHLWPPASHTRAYRCCKPRARPGPGHGRSGNREIRHAGPMLDGWRYRSFHSTRISLRSTADFHGGRTLGTDQFHRSYQVGFRCRFLVVKVPFAVVCLDCGPALNPRSVMAIWTVCNADRAVNAGHVAECGR